MVGKIMVNIGGFVKYTFIVHHRDKKIFQTASAKKLMRVFLFVCIEQKAVMIIYMLSVK